MHPGTGSSVCGPREQGRLKSLTQTAAKMQSDGSGDRQHSLGSSNIFIFFLKWSRESKKMPKICVQISRKDSTYLNVTGIESIEQKLKYRREGVLLTERFGTKKENR